MPSTTPIRELTKDWSPERLARVEALVAKYKKQIKAAALRAKGKKQAKRSSAASRRRGKTARRTK